MNFCFEHWLHCLLLCLCGLILIVLDALTDEPEGAIGFEFRPGPLGWGGWPVFLLGSMACSLCLLKLVTLF